MEANVKETRAEWPADGMATLIFPNGLRKIYRKLRDPKEQDAVMSWLGRYILTGEDRANYKVQEYLKILLKDEVSRIFRKQKANTENGRRGGSQTQANRKRASSEAEANDKRTPSEEEANEERTSSKIKGKGKDKVGGKPPTERENFPTQARACVSDAGESPGEEARRLGYGQYAEFAGTLRKLVPSGIPLAAVYKAAEACGFNRDELLMFANHYAGYGWRRGQGQGGRITKDTIGNVLAVWASRRGNFAKQGDNHGSAGYRKDNRGNGPRTDAAAYVEDPFG